ncbi:MAG: UDP-N-acetylmuramate dehydrogenase [Lachnospiraceae bacterium]|nr:UDP-N-acetylmuramate dehydrogenase [Lachnospiraceae bacterium]
MDRFKLLREFTELLGADSVRADENMSPHCSFRAGGNTAFLLEPGNREELSSVIALCEEEGADWFILGRGSNLLVSDEGYEGVMIRLSGEFAETRFEGETLRAGAAAALIRVAAEAADRGLTGLEFASGIPGSLGGALCMNAGAYGGEMADVVYSAEVLFPGEGIRELSPEELDFGYRHSIFKEKKAVALGAVIRLSYGDKEEIKRRMEELKEKRLEKQPLEFPSAGSTFKRPEGDFAGRLIQEAGLKELSVGAAQISGKHAGFIINRGGATASDIYALIRKVREEVYGNSGIMLEPEIELLGFTDEN